MPIDDSGTKSVVYAAMVDGEYVPITFGEFVESVLVPTICDKVIPMLQDEALELHVKFWKRLPAEIRFPKKHRRQASIDRKKRKERRRCNGNL